MAPGWPLGTTVSCSLVCEGEASLLPWPVPPRVCERGSGCGAHAGQGAASFLGSEQSPLLTQRGQYLALLPVEGRFPLQLNLCFCWKPLSCLSTTLTKFIFHGLGLRGLLVPGLEVNAEPMIPKINSLFAVLSLLLTLRAARLAGSPGAGGASAPASDWCPRVVPVRFLQVRAVWGERPFLPKREQSFFQTPELALPCRRLALWLPVSWQPEVDEVILIKCFEKQKGIWVSFSHVPTLCCPT